MGRGNRIWGGVVMGGPKCGGDPMVMGDPFWGCTHLDSIEEGEPWGRGTLNGGDVLAGGGGGGRRIGVTPMLMGWGSSLPPPPPPTDCTPCNPGPGPIALLVVADVAMTLLIAGGAFCLARRGRSGRGGA